MTRGKTRQCKGWQDKKLARQEGEGDREEEERGENDKTLGGGSGWRYIISGWRYTYTV